MEGKNHEGEGASDVNKESPPLVEDESQAGDPGESQDNETTEAGVSGEPDEKKQEKEDDGIGPRRVKKFRRRRRTYIYQRHPKLTKLYDPDYPKLSTTSTFQKRDKPALNKEQD